MSFAEAGEKVLNAASAVSDRHGYPMPEGGLTAESVDQELSFCAVRDGKVMAYVTVEDELSSIELLCFNRVIETNGSYMAVNTPVLVKGRLSVRDEKPPQIMCDSIFPLKQLTSPGEDAAKPPAKEKEATIYLRVPSLDSREFRHIKLVMTMFEGETPVKIRVADTGKLLGGQCLNHPALLQECREWLGVENVVVKEKK